MPYYPRPPAVAYWVWADSADIARELVALNVGGAISARDGRVFQCYENDTMKPPPGIIYSDSRGPIPISFLG
jgi:hypothetical protein